VIRLIADLTCILFCLTAMVFDVRSYRIPNYLTAPCILVGLALGTALGAPHLSLAGAAFAFAIFMILGSLKMFGMGDVKLMAGVGAFLGWPLVLVGVLHVFAAGGLQGGALALKHRTLKGVRVPYGVSIFVGTAFTVLLRYVPELRWF
jgi:Flp pilus assembly protein protease CpaA